MFLNPDVYIIRVMNSIVYMPYSYMSVVSSGFIVTNTFISDNEEGDVLLEDDED